MSMPAHCSIVSSDPPSPTPVSPTSVSITTTFELWLKVGCRVLGRPAASVGAL
jgi:hypothetical protein